MLDRAVDALTGFVFYQFEIFGEPVEGIVIWMAAPMILLTLYFRFVNLRAFGVAFDVLRGKYRDDTAPGEVTQFQALATALSGTVGLGNIAGVAIAIAMGGPGATFWMIIIGFVAMTLKCAECTLGVKYRVEHPDGTVSGGPMYYLQHGLAALGWRRLGLVLGWSYAILALPAILQLAQVNQAHSQVSSVVGFEFPWVFGGLMAVAVGVVLIGGLRSIAAVTVRLVPLMGALYIAAAMFIIIGHIDRVPAAVGVILREALTPEAGIGGVIGAIVWGMRRAVYSSEAGLGSASIAHAAARTREPASEGIVALAEPFIDTVVICTMTALVIVITGAYLDDGLNDIQMTSAAFNSVIAGFDVVLAVAVVLFAYSTILAWGYYMGKVWSFVFGRSRASDITYKLLYCLLMVPGAAMTVEQVVDIMDSFFFLMAVPNIIGIYLLAPTIRRELKSYLTRLREGRIPAAKQDQGHT